MEFGFGVWDLGLWALGFRIASYMVNKEDYLPLCPLSQIQKMKPSQFGIYFSMNLHVRWGLAKLLKYEKNVSISPVVSQVLGSPSFLKKQKEAWKLGLCLGIGTKHHLENKKRTLQRLRV